MPTFWAGDEVKGKLDFLAGQSLKLNRNTCFCRSKTSLVVNLHDAKPERMAYSIMCTSTFCLFKGAHMTATSGQSAWGIWV